MKNVFLVLGICLVSGITGGLISNQLFCEKVEVTIPEIEEEATDILAEIKVGGGLVLGNPDAVESFLDSLKREYKTTVTKTIVKKITDYERLWGLEAEISKNQDFIDELKFVIAEAGDCVPYVPGQMFTAYADETFKKSGAHVGVEYSQYDIPLNAGQFKIGFFMPPSTVTLERRKSFFNSPAGKILTHTIVFYVGNLIGKN